MNDNISIADDEYNGEKLKATTGIKEGDLIFIDKPFAWTFKHDYNLTRCYCYFCGNKCIVNNDIIHCDDNNYCPEIYCSLKCMILGQEDGHQWMCSKNIDIQLLTDIYHRDERGHIIVVLKIYCKIAQKYITQDNNNDPMIIAKELLHGYISADYCQTQHARRGGLSIYDSNLFNDLIAPAYFDSNLANPLENIKLIFENNKVWDDNDIDNDRKARFLQSEIFSSMFFRSLTGTMVVNNLQIKVKVSDEISSSSSSSSEFLYGSGLYPIYCKMNHSCSYNVRNEINERSTDISVYAARDIDKDEDILTTYLHDDPMKLKKSQRKRQLVQYLFICSCNMCNEQETDDDDDEEEEDDDDL